MAKRFNPEQTLQLVKLYKDHECLWNIYSDKYKNAHLKKIALMDICAKLNITGFTTDDLKIKIKTIRSTYCIELDKIENSVGTDKVYTPKVIWFNELNSFIRDVTMKKRRIKEDSDLSEMSIIEKQEHNRCSDDQTSEIEEYIEEEQDDTQETGFRYEDQDSLGKAAYEIIIGETSDTTEPRKRRIYQLDTVTNTIKFLREDENDVDPIFKPVEPKLRRIAPKPTVETNQRLIAPKLEVTSTPFKDHTYFANVTPPRDGAIAIKDEDDEFNTFGKHVANQLRKLSTLKYIMAQEEIQCTITKFLMDDMSELDTS